MTRVQKKPKLSRPGLKEMCHEQIEAVPGYRDDGPDAKAPRAILTSEYDHKHINQRLEQVQTAKLRNKDSRYSQG